MNKPLATTLFSGGGGADLGLAQAGFQHCQALEYDPEIAEVFRENIGDVFVENILNADPNNFEVPDWLHASPVCKSYSTAKTGAKETQFDIDCAKKISEFIYALQPRWFSLENVAAYGNIRNAKGRLTAFGKIIHTLRSEGYGIRCEVLTASHYGVPQSRKRLILVAEKGNIPSLPKPKTQVGWHQAIANLIPSCKRSQFADWQMAKAQGIAKPFVMSSTEQRANTIRYADQPIFTIKASDRDPRALIESGEVIQLNPDCLAALQTFPKDYRFGNKIEITRKIIGNAVPPLMFAEIVKAAIAPKANFPSMEIARAA